MPIYPPFAPVAAAPSDNNLLGWTGEPRTSIQAGTIMPTAGLLTLVRIRVYGSLVTNIHMHCTTTATGLTSGQCLAALYSSAGALLSATASAHGTGATGWGDGGAKLIPLTTPQVTTFGAFYFVGFFANTATSLPTFSRCLNSSGAIVDIGQTGTALSHATADGSLTTTMPPSLGAMTASATAYWVGVS